jgi:hypothetical protein
MDLEQIPEAVLAAEESLTRALRGFPISRRTLLGDVKQILNDAMSLVSVICGVRRL